MARNLATGLGLKDDVGTFFWHPPVYPLVASVWIELTGSAGIDFTTAMLDSRALNVIFSACTAALLVLLGRRLLDLRAGLLMGFLFMGDLFVQRINRRAMLETPVVLLMVLGLYLFYRYRERGGRGAIVGAGVAFGLAVLTKEVAVLGLFALGAWVIVFQGGARRALLGVTGIVAGMYAVYAAWALATDPTRYLAFQIGALSRIFALGRGVVPAAARLDSGANPGIIERLGPAFLSYGPTYLLLGFGALATVSLAVRYRERPAAQLLLCWSAVSYATIGFGEVAGFGDQFFYYVLVPAIAVIAYLIVAAWPAVDRPAIRFRRIGLRLGAVGLVLVLLGAYDATVWVARYATKADDGYARIERYVLANVPPGSTIVAGADVSNFLFRPEYKIEFFREQASVLDAKVQYFILSTKEVQQRYNRMTPAFYDWVRAHTTPLLEVQGDTYLTLGLYRWVG